MSEPECPPIPRPVRNIAGVRYYIDENNSIPDEQLKALDRRAIQPIVDFETTAVTLSDQILASPLQSGRAAACLDLALRSWSADDALLGSVNGQGAAHRTWTTVGISNSYLVLVRHYPQYKTPAIDKWLTTLAQNILRDAEARHKRDNLTAWSAAAVTTVAVATNQRAMAVSGVKLAKQVTRLIDDQGRLPYESKRGSRSVAYHALALTGLLLTSLNANYLDVEQSPADLDALKRTARYLLEQPKTDAQITPPNMAWLELYYDLTKDPLVLDKLEALRPVKHRHIGNLTLLYGSADQ